MLVVREAHMVMPLPPNNVGKGILFLGFPSVVFVCLFTILHLDRYCDRSLHSISWKAWTILLKLTGIIH